MMTVASFSGCALHLFKASELLNGILRGVPAVVDLACMRDAMKDLGSDPEKINPLLGVF